MARRVYFAFHYADVLSFRANVVRNSWVTQRQRGNPGFFDASIWEDAKTHGVGAVKALIDREITGTSVTAILVGAETYARRWVRYEIARSFERGNGLLAVRIHNIKDRRGYVGSRGSNPLRHLAYTVERGGTLLRLFSRTYYLNWFYNEAVYADMPVIANRHGLRTNRRLDELFRTYDWVVDDGYANFGTWVEEAAVQVGKRPLIG